MFERFTDRARRVLVLAQDEARLMDHNFLGTEHILLGMLKEGEGVAAKALAELGVEQLTLRAQIAEIVKPGVAGAASGAPPFTPRAKKVLELSLREALTLGHNYIGTEHLLLGLIHEGEGVGAQVLVAAGLDLSRVRAKVVELISGFSASAAGGRPGAAPVGAASVGGQTGPATPAAVHLPTRARAKASGAPVGSHHYLLGMLEDSGSLAARVLQSFGVTLEAAAARIVEIGTAGTTDELPTASHAPFEFHFGSGVTLTVANEEMAIKIAAALKDPGTAETPEQRLSQLGQTIGDILAVSAQGDDPDVVGPTDNDNEEDGTDAVDTDTENDDDGKGEAAPG